VSIALIGLPGAGKTTVSEGLAAELGLTWADTDAVVEQEAGMPVAEIFARDGEARFRELEVRAVRAALGSHGVVSLGGGAVMTEEVRDMLAGHQVIWLDAPVPDLAARLAGNQDRPLLKPDVPTRLAELDARRRPVFEEVATWRVDATGSVEEVLAQAVAVTRSDTITVAGEREYEVVVGHKLLDRVAPLVLQAAKVAVVHPPVLGATAAHLAAGLPGGVTVPVPDAEPAKTVEVLSQCWRELARAGLTRSDTVVGLGGGSTTDLAGFVAATFLRGVALVNIPTTVLGMADAAVGGKTGINLPEGKNLVGAFYEPRAVICDLDLLSGLGADQVRSGLAEIVKCGFIADKRILAVVGAQPEAVADVTSPAFFDVLTRAIRVKAAVVGADFREQGGVTAGREALNYGHTLGHAIEQIEGFTWAHGDADAVGMVFVAEVAYRLGMIGVAELDRHKELLSGLGLPVTWAGPGWADVREIMGRDKKARGSTLRFVLLEGIGRVKVVPDIDEDVLRESYAAIGGRA